MTNAPFQTTLAETWGEIPVVPGWYWTLFCGRLVVVGVRRQGGPLVVQLPGRAKLFTPMDPLFHWGPRIAPPAAPKGG